MDKEKILRVPIKRDTGELFTYIYNYKRYPDGNEDFEWIDNRSWTDTIYIDDMVRGRSAAHFIVRSEISGKEYPMFMKDMLDMVQNHTVENGMVFGCFTYCKRGTNYGIKMV